MGEQADSDNLGHGCEVCRQRWHALTEASPPTAHNDALYAMTSSVMPSWLRGAPSMCAKRALASSAAFAASRGRMKTLGMDSIAAMDRISLEHLQWHEAPSRNEHGSWWARGGVWMSASLPRALPVATHTLGRLLRRNNRFVRVNERRSPEGHLHSCPALRSTQESAQLWFGMQAFWQGLT